MRHMENVADRVLSDHHILISANFHIRFISQHYLLSNSHDRNLVIDKMNAFFRSAVLFPFIFALSALSQTKPFTLSDYVNAALVNNPLIASAVQARSAADYSNEATRKAYYPQIGVGSHFIFAPGYDQAITNGGEFGAQIAGTYVIYDGGAKSYEIQKGGIGAELGELNLSKSKADIIFSVSTAFVSAVKEKKELQIATQGYDLLEEYLQLVKQLQASGHGSETDVLKTSVDLNNARIEVDTRKIDFANSLLSLSEVTGLPSKEVANVDSTFVSISYDTTFEEQSNVDLLSGELQLKQSELDAQLLGAKLNPTFSLGADAGALSSLPNVRPGLEGVFGASIGLSITMPLFTFGSIDDNLSASQATARSISLENNFVRISLERDFERTMNDINKAGS